MKKTYILIFLALLMIFIIFLYQNNRIYICDKNPQILINKLAKLDEREIKSINVIVMKENNVEASYFFPGISSKAKDDILNLVKNIKKYEPINYPKNKSTFNYLISIDIESNKSNFHIAFHIDVENFYLNLVEISSDINSLKTMKIDYYYLLNKDSMEIIKRVLNREYK